MNLSVAKCSLAKQPNMLPVTFKICNCTTETLEPASVVLDLAPIYKDLWSIGNKYRMAVVRPTTAYARGLPLLPNLIGFHMGRTVNKPVLHPGADLNLQSPPKVVNKRSLPPLKTNNIKKSKNNSQPDSYPPYSLSSSSSDTLDGESSMNKDPLHSNNSTSNIKISHNKIQETIKPNKHSNSDPPIASTNQSVVKPSQIPPIEESHQLAQNST